PPNQKENGNFTSLATSSLSGIQKAGNKTQVQTYISTESTQTVQQVGLPNPKLCQKHKIFRRFLRDKYPNNRLKTIKPK
ncbi:1807_t:CDS:2, partial [Ambispora leptoticha]